jgi:hypothetical protein
MSENKKGPLGPAGTWCLQRGSCHLTVPLGHVHFRFTCPESFIGLWNRCGAIRCRAGGGEDGGGSVPVAGCKEKRLFAGCRDPRRVEARGTRDKGAGCSDMRLFIGGGVSTDARDERREAA